MLDESYVYEYTLEVPASEDGSEPISLEVIVHYADGTSVDLGELSLEEEE